MHCLDPCHAPHVAASAVFDPAPSQVQEQQGRIARFQSEVALLESALADSQKQAMSLNAKLSLSDSKNEELMNQIEVSFGVAVCGTQCEQNSSWMRLAKHCMNHRCIHLRASI